MITIPGGFWYPPHFVSGTGLILQTTTLNAAAEKVAAVFRVPRSGVLNRCEFKLGTVGNNPDNGLRVSFQNLDASGNPDGTQDQFRTLAGPFASNSWNVPGLMTSDGTDTGTKRTVTAGDRIAFVIEFESFVAGDSVQVDRLVTTSVQPGLSELYTDEFVTGAWVKRTAGLDAGMISIALEYETGGYENIHHECYPALTVSARTFNNASTPDEAGVRFQVPVTCVCDGAWTKTDQGGTGDLDVVLYDNADTVIASATVDASATATGVTTLDVRWAPVTLSANTTYRLTVRPSSGGAVSHYEMTVSTNALLAAAPAGVQWYRTTRTDAGAWTDTTTALGVMGIHISQLEESGDVIHIATQSPVIVVGQGVVGY